MVTKVTSLLVTYFVDDADAKSNVTMMNDPVLTPSACEVLVFPELLTDKLLQEQEITKLIDTVSGSGIWLQMDFTICVLKMMSTENPW